MSITLLESLDRLAHHSYKATLDQPHTLITTQLIHLNKNNNNTMMKYLTPTLAHKPTKNMREHSFSFFLPNLPSEIILEILTRLPAKSVARFKCVCRTWRRLLSSPKFVETHFALAKPGLIVHYTEMFRTYLRLVEIGDGYDHGKLQCDNGFRSKFDLACLKFYPDSKIVVDGSCDGFLLLRDVNYKHEAFYVCNPVRHEYVVLPEPKTHVLYPDVVTHGFGVVSGTYKVVRIYQERVLDSRTRACLEILTSKCQVHTLGTETWRDVGDAPLTYASNSLGLFFKGNLHWLVDYFFEFEPDLISCFDVEKEKFVPFPSPFKGRKIMGSLGNLNGYLCLCDNTTQLEIDVWVMKEYGAEKSWIKEIVIKNFPEQLGPPYEVVNAVKIFRDGVILLLWGDRKMVFYCSKSNTGKEVDLDQILAPNSIEAMHFVPSFLSFERLGIKDVYMLS